MDVFLLKAPGNEYDFLSSETGSVFLQARYKDVVDTTYERKDWSPDDKDASIAIAALAFVGRLDESQMSLKLAQKSASFDAHQRIFANFYIATALTRQGHYAAARKLLIENFWSFRNVDDRTSTIAQRSLFYIAQGFAFFRFVGGQYSLADGHARIATSHALLAKFPYGRVLALDIQGHCLHHLGMHRESLQTMEDATRLAHKLEMSSLADNISFQQELFQARFSVNLTSSQIRLDELSKQVRFQNSYSQSLLMLELARIAAFQGRISAAKSLLMESSLSNKARDDRRLKVQQNLRSALIADMSGEALQAHVTLMQVLATLNPKMDTAFFMHALGHIEALENTHQELTKTANQTESLNTSHMQRSGRYLAKRIARRTPLCTKILTSGTQEGFPSDQLGELLDQVARRSVPALRILCQQGSTGLAVRTFGLTPRVGRFIAIFSSDRHFLIGDHGDISFQSIPMTELMLNVLQRIAAGDGSMEALANNAWSIKNYHPLRHDPQIYRVLSKLRSALGTSSHWIKTTPSGYLFPSDVEILAITEDGQVSRLSRAIDGQPIDNSIAPASMADQIQSFVATHGRASNRDIVAKFKISPVTAARELSRLVEKRRLKRMGAGRSTTYIGR